MFDMTYIVYLPYVVPFTTLQVQGDQTMAVHTQNYKPVDEKEEGVGPLNSWNALFIELTDRKMWMNKTSVYVKLRAYSRVSILFMQIIYSISTLKSFSFTHLDEEQFFLQCFHHCIN